MQKRLYLSKIDTTELLQCGERQQYYVTQIGTMPSKDHCILRGYYFSQSLALHNHVCAIREIMQSFALFLLWHIHDYVTQETKRSSSPLKYNDLLMAQCRFVLHNIAVSHHTTRVLQCQFWTNKAAFACEFAQLTGLSLTKSQIFM